MVWTLCARQTGNTAGWQLDILPKQAVRQACLGESVISRSNTAQVTTAVQVLLAEKRQNNILKKLTTHKAPNQMHFYLLLSPLFSTDTQTTPIFSPDKHFLCLQCHCPMKAVSELKYFLSECGSTSADYFLRDLSFSICLTSDSLYEKMSPSHLVTVRLLHTQISSATCHQHTATSVHDT